VKGEPTGFWGKLDHDEDGRAVAWHPLEAHCADVAAVAEALLRRTLLGRRLVRLLDADSLSDVWVARLCVLAAIHDAGKVNHGFQDRALGHQSVSTGHVAPLVSAFQGDRQAAGVLDALGLRQLVEWFVDPAEAYHCLLAAFEHHGRPFRPSARFQRELWYAEARRDPLAGLRQLREATRRWFPAAYDSDQPPMPASSEFQHAFNGLVTLADWIGSDADLFPYAEDDADRMPFARAQAAHVLRRMGLDVRPARRHLSSARPGFDAVCEHPPRPVQEACARLEDHAGGSLLILESETGSGKTEAALTRFVQLLQAGLVDGMYFALPTRAAAMQIHGRVREAVQRAFPDASCRPPVVQAVPGYFAVDEATGRQLPGFQVLWDDDDRMRWRHRGWAAENPKRYLAAAIAVGTIDQVLLSTLCVRHAHLRATALMRQLLVVDEVHASDAYMGHLLEHVVRHHLRAGGHALLMSATLGSVARSRLLSDRHRGPSLAEAVAAPYPLISHVDASRSDPELISADSAGQPKLVHVSAEPLAADPIGVARVALGAARQGARVLVIRNTVTDCVATHQALEEVAGADEPALFRVAGVTAPHHSRFARPDRELLDASVERAFGKGASGKGVALVATQTVEQSLDIDADLMLSDLCPADVLLQRIGRLHRHSGRIRPDICAQTRLIVLVPEERALDGFICPDGKARGPHGLGTVYEDLCMLEATWRQIERKPVWRIPAMNREIVEAVTHPDALQALTQELGGRWLEHRICMRGILSAQTAHAGLALLPRSDPFGEQGFPEDPGERIKTRLGESDRLCSFGQQLVSPFGQPFDELTIPWYYAEGADENATAQNVIARVGTVQFDFGEASFVYDRLGLRSAEATHSQEGGMGND